jgi:very-short-patch-repair endonuclease
MSRVVQQARRFRKMPTRHEKRFWSHLRDRKLGDLKFRRQVPLGDRVVDFFCAEAHLAVEAIAGILPRRQILIEQSSCTKKAFGLSGFTTGS